tara:strand:- start:286 stop:807 length:522 start_codon:yes stop_codon:yes gene_type:complete
MMLFFCLKDMLEGLQSKLNRMKVDDNTAWFYVVDMEAQFEIIRLNTEDQLFEEGIDSKGDRLEGFGGINYLVGGEYAPYTVMKKKEKGQRYDHPTLKNSGGFYKSFFVKIDERGMQISADFNVTGDEGGSGNILDSLKNGLNVLGLTDDNLVLLRKMILVNYIKFLRDKIAIA